MGHLYDFEPINHSINFDEKFVFIDYEASFPLLEKYSKRYKKLKGELEAIGDPQASVLVRLFLSHQTVPFKPHEATLLALLRSSVALVRQNALYCFDSYYAKEIGSLANHTFWLSGSVENYKLAEIRTLLREEQSKVVTRFSKNVDLLVVGEKSKLEVIPCDMEITSTLSFTILLDRLNACEEEVVETAESIDETDESLLIEKLLSANNDELLELLNGIEESLSGDLLSLVLAMFKVHPEKNIRAIAKKLIENEPSKSAKELLNFCEKRNYINAKYTIGMEEMEKIKGFEIDLFLYYLVTVQKNHLGKEYLARLDGYWTERFIEESRVLNQPKLELFGKAGKRFVSATNIEEFTVHALSDTLWRMSGLRYLEIIENREAICLPKKSELTQLDSLVLESKEILLSGVLTIKSLQIKKCKSLEIEESFSVESIELLSFDGCSFNMKELREFFERVELPLLQKISFKEFANYKVPKDWRGFLEERFPHAKIVL
jgi:hypothetical protein